MSPCDSICSYIVPRHPQETRAAQPNKSAKAKKDETEKERKARLRKNYASHAAVPPGTREGSGSSRRRGAGLLSHSFARS